MPFSGKINNQLELRVEAGRQYIEIPVFSWTEIKGCGPDKTSSSRSTENLDKRKRNFDN